ncbi:MAG: hypothetical protein U0491_00720 [Candidatus Saccharimonadales bacterium]
MNEHLHEHAKPNFYSLEALSTSTPLPNLAVGDMITFENGKVTSLIELADNLAVDLLRDRDTPIITAVRDRLANEGTDYDALSEEDKEIHLPKGVGYFVSNGTDSATIEKKVMRGFKTGLELLSAELIYKGPILINTATPKEFQGWLVRVTPSLRLPGMLESLDATFPFVVAHDGKNLRFGPYDRESQKIGNVNTPAMRHAIASARSIAGVALSSAGNNRTTFRKNTGSGNGTT